MNHSIRHMEDGITVSYSCVFAFLKSIRTSFFITSLYFPFGKNFYYSHLYHSFPSCFLFL
uniref:Uncharacterized protein n=1 Tax=Arundo donax TaxID=35708 RepID=A0A0A9DR15_ARUDO